MWILRNSTYLLLGASLITFGILAPSFFSWQNLVNILIQSASLGIIATGMTFVLLTAGIDLSVGSIMFLVGVISGKMAVSGQSVWLVCFLGIIVGLLFGLLNALFIYRIKVIPFIVTLATFYIGRGIGLYISETRAINLPEQFLQIGTAKIMGIPFPVLVLLVVILSGHWVLRYTLFGRRIYAVGHDREKARKAGIPVNRILLLVYVICGGCAALGGLVALAQLGAVSPTFGYQNEFTAIAAAVLGGTSLFGGKGHILPGTLFGALFIQSLQNGLVLMNTDPYLYPLITGSIIFVIVMTDSLQYRRKKQERSMRMLRG